MVCLCCGKTSNTYDNCCLTLGGNVRVGLEDSLFIGPGTLAKSSAEQVMLIREIAERLSLEIATPDEAREILELKMPVLI